MVDAARANATTGEADEAAQMAAQMRTGLSDDELRQRREVAQQSLKRRRERSLSSAISVGAFDAAIAAASAAAAAADNKVDGARGLGGAMASWAAAQRKEMEANAEAEERYQRLCLFSSDLELLGVGTEEQQVRSLDEKTLRRAFRERSRVLHPDACSDYADIEGVPSVYELNAAFENLRQLLKS